MLLSDRSHWRFRKARQERVEGPCRSESPKIGLTEGFSRQGVGWQLFLSDPAQVYLAALFVIMQAFEGRTTTGLFLGNLESDMTWTFASEPVCGWANISGHIYIESLCKILTQLV